MSSQHSHTYSRPVPVSRDSTSSGSSSTLYERPTSMERCTSQGSYASASHSQMSPTEQSFLGAISRKIRDRSRSRSRARAPDHDNTHRSKSPRPSQSRQFSTGSADSAEAKPVKRQSTDSSAASNPWYGRHSNSWLFNDFSVTGHVSDAYNKLRRHN